MQSQSFEIIEDVLIENLEAYSRAQVWATLVNGQCVLDMKMYSLIYSSINFNPDRSICSVVLISGPFLTEKCVKIFSKCCGLGKTHPLKPNHQCASFRWGTLWEMIKS